MSWICLLLNFCSTFKKVLRNFSFLFLCIKSPIKTAPVAKPVPHPTRIDAAITKVMPRLRWWWCSIPIYAFTNGFDTAIDGKARHATDTPGPKTRMIFVAADTGLGIERVGME